MSSSHNHNTRSTHIHTLALQPAEYRRLAKQVLPFGYTARVIRCPGMQPGDIVRALDRASLTAFELEVSGVFNSERYPGVELGCVVAVLQVRP